MSASHTLVLTTEDRLLGPDFTEQEPLSDVADGAFYVVDRDSDPYYNLVRVEVVAWRI
ncbi:DUF7288 family protein [Halovenus salina]|uniref:Uncharacterized protein n=1 Tax=Halovenus salina TaxID=1510225 RepID=A0ABD5VXC8_9EURY